MSVRLSARGLGVRPLFSSPDSMKKSMGEVHQALFLTAGRAGRLTGWKAQCFRWASVMVKPAAGGAGFATPSGHGAPILTQVVSASISSAFSFPAGGILTGPV